MDPIQPITMVKTKNPIKVQQGKKARRKGREFEQATRQYLISLGYYITRWNNIIDTTTIPHTLQQAKYNRFHTNTGFPDLLAFKPIPNTHPNQYTLILIECKTNNTLTKQEKLQLNHYQHTLHIPCYIAYPDPTTNTPTLRGHLLYTPNTPKTPDFQPQTPTPPKVDPKQILKNENQT